MTKNHRAGKRFLNEDGYQGLAALGWDIVVNRDCFIEGEIRIADCNRVIYLNLSDDWDNRKAEKDDVRSNNLAKIEKMIEELTLCRDAYIASIKQSKRQAKKLRKEMKKQKGGSVN